MANPTTPEGTPEGDAGVADPTAPAVAGTEGAPVIDPAVVGAAAPEAVVVEEEIPAAPSTNTLLAGLPPETTQQPRRGLARVLNWFSRTKAAAPAASTSAPVAASDAAPADETTRLPGADQAILEPAPSTTTRTPNAVAGSRFWTQGKVLTLLAAVGLGGVYLMKDEIEEGFTRLTSDNSGTTTTAAPVTPPTPAPAPVETSQWTESTATLPTKGTDSTGWEKFCTENFGEIDGAVIVECTGTRALRTASCGDTVGAPSANSKEVAFTVNGTNETLVNPCDDTPNTTQVYVIQ